MGPKIMHDEPSGMNIEDMWVIDQACPQSELGVGALEWETAVPAMYEATVDGVSSDADVPDQDQLAANSTASYSVGPSSNTTKLPAPQRLLTKANSEPLDG